LLVIAVIAVVLWALWPKGEDPPAAPEDNRSAPAPADTAQESNPAQQPIETAPEQIAAPPDNPTAQPTQAKVLAIYNEGIEKLQAGEILQARTLLNRAYYSGAMPPETLAGLRTTLTELANVTLIGPGSSTNPDDPYAFAYTFQPGEVLARVERTLHLHVPWPLLLRANNLSRAEGIQAGRRYKMIYGPFHAVIYKSQFLMDVFLQREGLEKVFVRRFTVGTGANGSTPAGLWRVRLGGKQHRPTWYPPPNSSMRGPIPYGHPDYAFGVKGLWISLEGLDDATRDLPDYGIHSTNDPTSIGKAASLGCIRLADDDIELLYQLLYEHWSTVEVRP